MPHTESESRTDYTEMSGTFADWTLADAEWYSNVCGYEFVIDGDRNRIFAVSVV